MNIPANTGPELGAPLEHWRLVEATGPGTVLGPEPVEILEEVDSTNDELVRRLQQAPEQVCSLQALLTEHQVAGRGRRERVWTSPRRSAAVVSFAVVPDGPGPGQGLPPEALHWVPMVLGLAGCEAVREVTGLPVGLKWPNDLLVDGQKVAGILGRAVPDARGRLCLVVGMGLNCNLPAQALPYENATTLSSALGVPVDRTALLERVIASFRRRMRDFLRLGGDPARPGASGRSLLEEVRSWLGTIGQQVRVIRSEGQPDLVGLAQGLDDEGALLVASPDPAGGTVVEAVSVGDVVHLRPASGQWPGGPQEQGNEGAPGPDPLGDGADSGAGADSGTGAGSGDEEAGS